MHHPQRQRSAILFCGMAVAALLGLAPEVLEPGHHVHLGDGVEHHHHVHFGAHEHPAQAASDTTDHGHHHGAGTHHHHGEDHHGEDHHGEDHHAHPIAETSHGESSAPGHHPPAEPPPQDAPSVPEHTPDSAPGLVDGFSLDRPTEAVLLIPLRRVLDEAAPKTRPPIFPAPVPPPTAPRGPPALSLA